MSRIRVLLAAVILLALGGVAGAEDAPIALDIWGRYHVNIVPFVLPAAPGVKRSWVPKVSLVFKVTKPETDDVVELQHYKGGKKWGPVQKCQISRDAMTERRGKGGASMGYYLVTPTCMLDEKLATQDLGKFSVDVSYKQTGRGKVYPDLGKYQYEVKSYNSGWLSKKGPEKSFYVDHDFRMGEAWAYVSGDGSVQIWTWFKYDRDGEQQVRGGRMRCFSGDDQLSFMDNPTGRTTIDYDHYTGNNKHDKVTWGLWYWYTGNVDGGVGAEWLAKHPGPMRCTLTQNGDISRELSFEVDADGKVKRPACQTADGPDQVRALPEEALLKMEFKKGADLPFDAKAYRSGGLYGRKWLPGCPP